MLWAEIRYMQMNFLFWVDSGRKSKYLDVRHSWSCKQWTKTVGLECRIQLKVWGCCKLTHFPSGSRAKPLQKLKGVLGSSDEPMKWNGVAKLAFIDWSCSTEPISIAAMQVWKYRRRKLLGNNNNITVNIY